MLEGIGEEVEYELLPHLAVDVDRLGQGRAIDRQHQARLLNCRAEDAGQFRRMRGQVGRLIAGLDAAGLETGEVQQRVDQP